MDFTLLCNVLHCRKPLVNSAIVTTCSHIFCNECANELFSSKQICPACETQLCEPDDIVVTNLRPSDDYKTSVLSGLSPDVIIDMAARGLSFWSYQVNQAIVYQEFLSKSLADKYTQLHAEMDARTRNVTAEIGSLRNTVITSKHETNEIARKNRELIELLNEKTKQFSKLKMLYDKLKRQALASPLADAARQQTSQVAASLSITAQTDISGSTPRTPRHQNRYPLGASRNWNEDQFREGSLKPVPSRASFHRSALAALNVNATPNRALHHRSSIRNTYGMPKSH